MPRILKNRCPCKVWPAHETTYHNAQAATSLPEPSIVLWLRSLFFFGLRWFAALVTGRVSMRPAYVWIRSRLRSNSSSEFQQLMEPGLKKVYSADVSKPSKENLEKLRESLMQHAGIGDFHLPKGTKITVKVDPAVKEEDNET